MPNKFGEKKCFPLHIWRVRMKTQCDENHRGMWGKSLLEIAHGGRSRKKKPEMFYLNFIAGNSWIFYDKNESHSRAHFNGWEKTGTEYFYGIESENLKNSKTGKRTKLRDFKLARLDDLIRLTTKGAKRPAGRSTLKISTDVADAY